jgi:di/tricarboxylate transporter
MEKIITLFVFILTIFLLLKGNYPASYIFALSTALLIIFGILSPEEALSGFSNPQIAIIILLLVISYVLYKTKAIEYILSKVIKENLSYKSFLFRLTLLTSFLSSFLNNTPVVASLLPYVHTWAKKKGISPSKVLIPLSFSAILGGTITLIGTSTNLVVNALYQSQTGKSLHLWDFTPLGLLATLLGILYMVFIGSKLLPERDEAVEKLLVKSKEYLVETEVLPTSELVGKTVKEANLRNLKGLFLVEILRNNKTLAPVSPDEIIKAGDILVFAGNTEAIGDLLNHFRGLVLPKICRIPLEQTEIVEALIPPNSDLIGKRIKETNFRARFDAAIVGIHRQGEKLKGKIGEQVLKKGDLLLLIIGKDFYKKVSDTKDIYVLSKVGDFYNFSLNKAVIALIIFISSLLFTAFGFISLFKILIFDIFLFLALKLIQPQELKRNLDLNLIFTAAFSLALGKAVVVSGLAFDIAYVIFNAFSKFGTLGSLLGLYLFTVFLTEFITNLGAVGIAFPIAVEVSRITGIDLKALTLLIAYASSASFLSPIGYQTNLMVFSLGNYRFLDFIKVGLPLTIMYAIIIIIGIYLFYLK